MKKIVSIKCLKCNFLFSLLIFLATLKHSDGTLARALFLTQSTVSRRLAVLEKELKVKLFTLGKGLDNVQLTPLGERFLTIAEQILALSIEGNSLEENNLTQNLSVAVPDSLASYILRGFLYNCQKKTLS